MNPEEIKKWQEFRYKCTETDFVADQIQILIQTVGQLKRRIEILEEEVKPKERISNAEFAKMTQSVKKLITENESEPKP